MGVHLHACAAGHVVGTASKHNHVQKACMNWDCRVFVYVQQLIHQYAGFDIVSDSCLVEISKQARLAAEEEAVFYSW